MLVYTCNTSTGFHMHTCMYKCTHMPVHTHTHTKKNLNYYTFFNFTMSALITFETYELKKKKTLCSWPKVNEPSLRISAGSTLGHTLWL